MDAGAIGHGVRNGKKADMGPVDGTKNEAAARVGSHLLGRKVDHRHDPPSDNVLGRVIHGSGRWT